MVWCCAAERWCDRYTSVRETARDFLTALLIFLAVFALAALDARPARPQTAAASAATTAGAATQVRTSMPAQLGSGTLLIRPAPQAKAIREIAVSSARRLGTTVDVTVTGPVARATVTQTFRKNGAEPVEGVYVFPLPEGAAVDTLTMRIGERSVVGEIRPLGEAQAVEAPTGGAGELVHAIERWRPDTFASTVASIAPGETVTVRLEYQQKLRWRDGAYSLRLPLAQALQQGQRPRAQSVRYDSRPPGTLSRDPAAANLSVRVKLDAGFPLGEIESASHAVSVKRTGDESALLTLQPGKALPDRDFELAWKPKHAGAPVARLFRQNLGNAEYVLAMITPPAQQSALPARPREVIFVVDTSGSMAGSSIHHVRDALEAAISRLGPSDRFNIIAFESTYEALFFEPVKADAEGKAIAKHFLSRLMARGGTEMIRPLSAALKDKRPDDTGHVRQIVLITDGAIAGGQQLFSEIAVKRGRSHLFLAGIGPEPDRRLLRHAAKVGRGGYVHIAAEAQLRERMDRFLKTLERPVLTDIRIDWPKGVRPETGPAPLPDLYAGEPLVVSARLETPPKAEIRLAVTGSFDGKPWSSEFKLQAAQEGTGVARLWARRKIASLESHNLYAGNDGGDIASQIAKVALEHRLVSRVTSLVAVDKSSGAAKPERAKTPPVDIAWPTYHAPIGDGTVRFRAERHDTPPESSNQRTPATALRQQVAVPPPPQRKPARNATDTIAPVPPAASQASLFSGRFAAVAIMALVFAAMSALTLGLWRHLGRNYTATRRGRRAVGAA